jgi:hypothetical protein
MDSFTSLFSRASTFVSDAQAQDQAQAESSIPIDAEKINGNYEQSYQGIGTCIIA